MIDERVKKWLLKALEDYKTIENEFRLPEEDIVTSSVCFHAQQFVEKALKAYLTFKNKDFGRTHNLEFLLKLCSEEDKEFEELDVGDLTFYAVEIRYPDEFYTPTLDEAKKAFDIAKKVKDFIFKKLSVKEEDLK
ncbi:MAG: HEPN domain-containing protein [candidate division WOR-3 bacterium]|jgi:HEPN domain-containing protein